jgi:hypothetical protein
MLPQNTTTTSAELICIRAGYQSTATALIVVFKNNVFYSDAGELAELVMRNFGETFDTTDLAVLVEILQMPFSVPVGSLSWSWTYLTDLTQIFCISTDIANLVGYIVEYHKIV